MLVCTISSWQWCQDDDYDPRVSTVVEQVGGRGGRVPPRDFWPGNFCWPIEEKEGRKNGKMEQERRQIEKGKVENENWMRKSDKMRREMRRGPFFFFFGCHFSKPLKFVLGQPKWEFSTWKKHFITGKNQEKFICPLRKIFLLRPWVSIVSRGVLGAELKPLQIG